MKLILSLSLALALIGGTSTAQTNPQSAGAVAEALMGDFFEHDRICKTLSTTGAGDNFGCGARYGVAVALYRLGWCYGQKGQASSNFEWDLCEPLSLAPGEMVLHPF